MKQIKEIMRILTLTDNMDTLMCMYININIHYATITYMYT